MVLLHAVPALLLPLIVMAINLFLDTQLDGTGGLSGIGLRSTLQTVQTVLSTGISLLCRDFRYILKMVGGIFLGSLLFSATPLSNGLVETITAINEDPSLANLTGEELMALLQARISIGDLITLYLLCAAGALIMVVPLFYKYRLSDYVLLTEDTPRALASRYESSRLMHGNRILLFRLDLHLW